MSSFSCREQQSGDSSHSWERAAQNLRRKSSICSWAALTMVCCCEREDILKAETNDHSQIPDQLVSYPQICAVRPPHGFQSARFSCGEKLVKTQSNSSSVSCPQFVPSGHRTVSSRHVSPAGKNWSKRGQSLVPIGNRTDFNRHAGAWGWSKGKPKPRKKTPHIPRRHWRSKKKVFHALERIL